MDERRYVIVPGAKALQAPYNHAVIDGGLIFVAGQVALDNPEWQGELGCVEDETRAVMDLLGRILATSGAGFADVLRVGVFMADLDQFDRMNDVYASYFEAGREPARTCVGVSQLIGGCLIEIDCIARLPI